jgi:hypothetical protein
MTSNEPQRTYTDHHTDAYAIKSKEDEKEEQDRAGN